MSKGQRMQQKHVHVNKYAKFSKAEGALARILAQQEKEQKEKEDKERKRTEGLGMSSLDRRIYTPAPKWYHHMNLEYDSLTGCYQLSNSRNYMPDII